MFLLKEINELYEKFSSTVYLPNVLDAKTKELIALSCAVMADCVPCLEHHYKKAIENGATDNEISEALAIAMSICAGSKKAKYTPVIEKLQNDKNKKI